MILLVLALLFGASLAQRPTDVSICDYYAKVKYGSASKDNQFQLLQGIVSLAFGGSSAIPSANVSTEITGILNPGVQDETPVNLLPWFNGTKISTNLNNQPVGINWLDDGGVKPLLNFLSGETQNVLFTNTSNEYRLFGHFFVAFSHIFGCSDPPASPPSTGGPLNLAYVHKFMDLDYNQLGYFIDQLTMSSEFYGFSPTDAKSLNTRMNSQYNVRCAPAVTSNPKSGPQLLSLCQNPTCPLAVPNADCDAYTNLTADGAGSASSGSTPSSTGIPVSSITGIATSSPSAATTTAVATSDTNKGLSAGGIAGVAVGGAAVLAFLAAAILFFRRKRKSNPEPESASAPAQPVVEQQWSESKSPVAAPPYGEQQSPYHSPGGHNSYVSQAHSSYVPPAEMESPRFENPAELSAEGGGNFNRLSPLQR